MGNGDVAEITIVSAVLKDANGRKAYLSLFTDKQLASGNILPGDKARGFLAFDIAPGASTAKISTPLTQEAARIQIPG